MIYYHDLIYGAVALVCAALISFAMTPPVRVLAHKLGAIDIPQDNRRMHKQPIPRLGGLAIYLGFVITSLVFLDLSPLLTTILLGGTGIVVLGMLDDIFRLRASLKFLVQIGIAFIAVWQGVTIEQITLFGKTINFGGFSILITVFWIVGLTNAINLIDGLDGLSCGVSTISAFSLLLVAILMGQKPESILMTAILAGACLGFLPFNTNPAKIFMGDTGALFLGYTLSVISVGGVLKLHTVVSVIIPLLIFALPLFDTTFAILRRVVHGKSPFAPDRGHLHHRLIDMGLNQKQTVAVLYATCALLGLSAILFTSERLWRAGIVILVGIIIFILNFVLLKNPKTQIESGVVSLEQAAAAEEKKAAQAEEDKSESNEG
ncbi:MAG: undecaprenyl/decaprenyl-phosphate alpha-N-acetylglucosaminyl 1-phosphate transferase [Clostridia bacterium]|nr:undecaprenyl/decaprenyl-phosphate alpha-N-acetylglucosaminyl 1-phosphate transferase [Clostridia bacterium]